MSDMYLILRSRLTEVADWLELGAQEMKEARKAQGLSYESASRLLHVSSKTYERREKAGRWPAHDIASLASVLHLEIEQPERQRITLDDPSIEARLTRIEATLEELADVRETAERIEALLLQQADTPQEHQASASSK
jgi:transcriptional regulator with XRE-family HTH domain